MPKLSKRTADQAAVGEKDYIIWDDDLVGFGLRVFTSGKRSYIVRYRALGRARRFTIGPHGIWTAETARVRARVLLGQVAQGDNPAEQRHLDHKATGSRARSTRRPAQTGLLQRNPPEADVGSAPGTGRSAR